jgi:hypothetical protein
MKRRGWIVALSLIVLGNLFALTGVALNRSGEPESSLVLTERELQIGFRLEEDSGISLELGLGNRWDRDWLGRDDLEALGFDLGVPADAGTAEFHYGKQLPRRGFVVLGYEGEAWRAWLAEREAEVDDVAAEVDAGEKSPEALEKARTGLERRMRTASRLFAVDAGADPAALREAYPDRGCFVILPAVFGVSARREWSVEQERFLGWTVQGALYRILVKRIHVGLEHRPFFEELEERARRRPAFDSVVPDLRTDSRPEEEVPGPRYHVALNVGRRYEPWIERVETLERPGVRGGG